MQAQSRTCSNRLLGIRTFTPGDRSTWDPGDAVSCPAASYLQRRSRNGFFTLICVGLQHLHETLERALPKLGFRLLSTYFSKMPKNIKLSVFNLKHFVKHEVSIIKSLQPHISSKCTWSKTRFWGGPKTETVLLASIWCTMTPLLSHDSNS